MVHHMVLGPVVGNYKQHGWLVDSRLSDLWLARFDHRAGL
jgi:hypothetical protein